MSVRGTAEVAKKKKSIRSRFRWALLGLACGPLLMTGLIIGWQTYTVQLEQARLHQREMTRRAALKMTDFINSVTGYLSLTVRLENLKWTDKAKRLEIFYYLLTQKDQMGLRPFQEISLLDLQGKRLACADIADDCPPPPQTEPIFVQDMLAECKKGNLYFGPVDFDDVTGEPLMVIAVPMLDIRTGQVWGVLKALIRFKEVWDIVGQFQREQTGLVFITDRQNRVVAHPDPSVVLRGTVFKRPGVDGVCTGLSGDRAMLVAEPISFGTQEFNVITERKLTDVLALTIRTGQNIFLTIILAIVAALIIGFWIEKLVVRPVEVLADQARRVGAGDLTQRVILNRPDEYGDLAEAFNFMSQELETTINSLRQRVDDLRQAQEALGRSEYKYRMLLESLPQRIFHKDVNSIYVSCNAHYADDLGINPEEITGLHDCDVHPINLAIKYVADDRQVMGGGRARTIEEKYYLDDGEIWIQTVKIPLYDEKGELTGTLGIFWDITEWKLAEQERSRYREQLEETVAEQTAELRTTLEKLKKEIVVRNRAERT